MPPKQTKAESLTELLALDQQRRAVEEEITRRVIAARSAGALQRPSWKEIGDVLGTSPQAAQKRYRDLAPRERRRSPSSPRPASGVVTS